MTFHVIWEQLLRNVIDIAIVAIIIYQIIAMLKGTRAAQVVVGLLVIFIFYAVSSLLGFQTLYWIISKFYASFIIVVIVLFQDDIRRILTRFGRGPFVAGLEEGSGLAVVEEVVSAAKHLSHERLGAIMVFERGIGLERLYDHAVRLDALVSEQLLLSVFQSFSPLHDGAVIIQKNRITCAAAHLPLSKTPGTGKKLGTRHSAAVGISEQTDSVVLVVSEETGAISVAVNGELSRQPSPEAARRRLVQLLLPQRSNSDLALFMQNRLFIPVNTLYIRVRSWMTGQKPYAGVERRRRGTERRSVASVAWHGDTDTVRAVARENRLAANEVRMNLRFPGSVPQSGSFRPMGGTVVLSNQVARVREAAREEAPLSSLPPQEVVGMVDEVAVLHEMSEADGSPSLTPTQTGVEQNEAAASLTQLRPEDRLVPPESRPTPPPIDVSIGGVALHPPLEEELGTRPKGESGTDESEKNEVAK
jgi:uncharacterized protein (TIGR00159 family)